MILNDFKVIIFVLKRKYADLLLTKIQTAYTLMERL